MPLRRTARRTPERRLVRHRRAPPTPAPPARQWPWPSARAGTESRPRDCTLATRCAVRFTQLSPQQPRRRLRCPLLDESVDRRVFRPHGSNHCGRPRSTKYVSVTHLSWLPSKIHIRLNAIALNLHGIPWKERPQLVIAPFQIGTR